MLLRQLTSPRRPTRKFAHANSLRGDPEAVRRIGISVESLGFDNPRPTRRIPIWFGGFSEIVFRRAARLGDGFIFTGPQERGTEGWKQVEKYLREAGREPAQFGKEMVVGRLDETPQAVAARIEWCREWGCTHFAVAFAVILTSAIPGCAAYKKCGLFGCPGDAQITSDVRALFNQRPALQPPNLIDVQTLDHVVYLYGLVDTEPERRLAESIALQDTAVTEVVNSIGIRNR